MPAHLQPLLLARTERAFARNLRAHVDIFRALRAGTDVGAIEIAGGVAVFVGVGSPLTTVKGLDANVSSNDLAEIEAFFRARGAPTVTVELAPWCGNTAGAMLSSRGYEVTGFEDVVSRTVEAPTDLALRELEVTPVAAEQWVAISRQGLEPPIDPALDELLDVAAHLPGAIRLAARTDGRTIACAQAVPDEDDEDTVIFANDTTVPAARRRGAQTALIQARLAMVGHGGLAMAEVAPNSGSERNYLRCGFEVAYTRTHYTRLLDSTRKSSRER